MNYYKMIITDKSVKLTTKIIIQHHAYNQKLSNKAA